MPLLTKLLSGIGLKLKARYFFPGLAVLIAVAALLVVNQQDEVRIGTADYEAVDEGASEQVFDPQDAWMYKIVEPSSDIDPQNIYSFACEIRTKRPETLTTVCADLDRPFGKLSGVNGMPLVVAGKVSTEKMIVSRAAPKERFRRDQPQSF